MKIKEIILSALNLIGRGDIAAALENGEELTTEASRTADTLLYCVNSVLDELARYYFPLSYTETVNLIGGKASFADFTYRPVKILGITSNGKKTAYKIYPAYLTADAVQIEAEYEYSPDKKGLDDDCDYSGLEAGARLIATGAVSEFCLLNGEVSEAEYWEGEYRREIDRARARLRGNIKIPPRRWV